METRLQTTSRIDRLLSNRTLMAGAAGGVAILALFMLTRDRRQPMRRYSDHGVERRNPMHFFLAGRFPQRRTIDRSGQRPLFERRQSVYDSY